MAVRRRGVSGRNLAVILIASSVLAACATPKPTYSVHGGSASSSPSTPPSGGSRYKVGAPYQVAGVWYVPKEDPSYDQVGTASWYGGEFHMKTTANGEVFDMNLPTAAHTTLPLPSVVEVTNLGNGRSILVRVNDRGPFSGGRIIDLSREAARQLDFERTGTARVRVRYVGLAPLDPRERSLRQASLPQSSAPSVQRPHSSIASQALTAPGPVAVSSTPLTPLTPSGGSASAAPVGTFRVQAGAFRDSGRAQAVADQVSVTGAAVVEPVQRGDGLTLYRVVVSGGSDEAAAWSVRDQVAALGFADARIVRP